MLVDWTDIVLDNPSIEPDFGMQVVSYFRGAEVAVFDRLSERSVINLTVMREWGSLGEATAWRYDARSLCPRVAPVSFSERDYKNGLTNRFLSNAAVILKILPNIGVATFTQVQIIGGKFTNRA